MKSKLVKLCLVASLGYIFCIMGLNDISAASMDGKERANAYASFAGAAGFKISLLSEGNRKLDANDTAGVRWTYSNKDSHKMWFQVTDYYANQCGKKLFNYLSQGPINTEGTYQGKDYYIRGSREHIGNPEAYVSGTWAP